MELCRAAAAQLREAALACARWEALQTAWADSSSERERRFRRRAYQRARDSALIAIALQGAARTRQERRHSRRRRAAFKARRAINAS